ncbi:MAG: hypothetical protein MZW92_30620 [Comamonadaceae bacterium]|nr:hypothetical protein [Comamonadaceae bacterium]
MRPLITAEAIGAARRRGVRGRAEQPGQPVRAGHLRAKGLRIDYGTSCLQTVTFDERGPAWRRPSSPMARATDPAVAACARTSCGGSRAKQWPSSAASTPRTWRASARGRGAAADAAGSPGRERRRHRPQLMPPRDQEERAMIRALPVRAGVRTAQRQPVLHEARDLPAHGRPAVRAGERRADVMKAPKGKLPYIDDGGTVVADTSFIIELPEAPPRRPARRRADRRCSAPWRRPSSACSRRTCTGPWCTRAGSRTPAGRKTREAFFGAHARAAALVRAARWRGAACAPSCAATAWAATARPRSTPSAAATCTAVADFLADKPFMLRRAADLARRHGLRLPGQPAVGAGRLADPAPRAATRPDAGGLLPAHEGEVLRLTGRLSVRPRARGIASAPPRVAAASAGGGARP